jgi:HK97 gp10 family phage protein
MAEVLEITGIKELDRRLKALEPKVAKKVLRQAMRKGLKTMLSRARALAPEGQSREINTKAGAVQHQGGLLRKRIKIVSSRSRSAVRIAILLSTRDVLKDAYYGAFVDEGTRLQRAQKFMERAFTETGAQVRDTALQDIWAGVEAAARA